MCARSVKLGTGRPEDGDLRLARADHLLHRRHEIGRVQQNATARAFGDDCRVAIAPSGICELAVFLEQGRDGDPVSAEAFEQAIEPPVAAAVQAGGWDHE